MALPELDGGLEPIVFAGRDSATGKSHSLPDRIASLTSRAIKWAQVLVRLSYSRIMAICHSPARAALSVSVTPRFQEPSDPFCDQSERFH